MKKGIHPDWHHDCKVTCSCGNTFIIGSIFESLQVDICNKCHPFFTGELKFVDRQGRVDRFNKKMATAQAKQQGSKKAVKKSGSQDEPRSYRDILRDQQAELRKTASKTTPAKAE